MIFLKSFEVLQNRNTLRVKKNIYNKKINKTLKEEKRKMKKIEKEKKTEAEVTYTAGTARAKKRSYKIQYGARIRSTSPLSTCVPPSTLCTDR